LKVAVIDDEADHREMIRESLLMNGHDVVEADNGITGLETIQAETPDLIICDVRMPKMNGDEMFDILRQSNKDLGLIPFIFLSGNASEKETISRLNRGADNCLDKPIELSLLSAYVNAHLSRMKRTSNYFRAQLDAIASAIPEAIEHDFNGYTSLLSDISGYVDAIVALINRQAGRTAAGEIKNCADCDNSLASLLENFSISRLDYISLCLQEYENRKQLVRTTNGEDLSWLLILIVTKAQIKGEKIPVSDLYLSAPSAKSTINARINSLIKDGVINKMHDIEDGRRQLVSLTDHFKAILFDHIDASIERLKRAIL